MDTGKQVTVWLNLFSAPGLTGVSRALIPSGSSGDELLLIHAGCWQYFSELWHWAFPFPCSLSINNHSRLLEATIPWLTVPFFHFSSQQQQAEFSSCFRSLWLPCATFSGGLICPPLLLLRIMRFHWAPLDSPTCFPHRKVKYFVTLTASVKSIHSSTRLVLDRINQKKESWRIVSRILWAPPGCDSYLTNSNPWLIH